MMRDQERDFRHACAEDEVLTSREHIGSSSEYLGDLPLTVSFKGLRLISKQYRLAMKTMPTGRNPLPTRLANCDDNCSVSVELGIPCCHKIYSKLLSGTRFTKWDVHPRWHLRESSSQDPYRRILDPKIATALRGRPKNDAQIIPGRLSVAKNTRYRSASKPTGQSMARRQVRQPKSPENPALVSCGRTDSLASQENIQAVSSSRRQTRSQSSVLGNGRTTGVRATGRRTQSSIRRRRSQWELLDSDGDGETVLSSIVVIP